VLACTTQTTDPAGSRVAYQFDWGDNSQSGWSGLMDGGIPYADTHTYTSPGSYEIRARAKNAKGRLSQWSDPLTVDINPGEGEVRWSFSYTPPEEPEDSAEFSAQTFAIAADSSLYILSSDFPALMARSRSGTRRWEYLSPEGDELANAPSIGDDGTIYFGTDGGTFYAINPNGTKRWEVALPGGAGVVAACALGADGSIYVQGDNDSLFALNGTNGSRRWSFYAGGGTQAPVIGADGTVYCLHDDTLFALEPGTGTPKWRYGMRDNIASAPAIDVNRSVSYVAAENGDLAAVDLSDGTESWRVSLVGTPSAPVLGSDGTIYITAGGRLLSLSPQDGSENWSFTPPLFGTASTPAISNAGIIYFLVIQDKDRSQSSRDTLYAVNSDGSRRWGCGLGVGLAAEFVSAPKIDASGYVYVGNGFRAWCVVGRGGPAQSSWPMYQCDGQNSGRARTTRALKATKDQQPATSN